MINTRVFRCYRDENRVVSNEKDEMVCLDETHKGTLGLHDYYEEEAESQ